METARELIAGVPLTHMIGAELGGQPVLFALEIPDTWTELDQLADIGSPAARSWLDGALAALERRLDGAANRAVGLVADAGEGGETLALLAVFVTFCEPRNSAVRQAAALRDEPFVTEVAVSGEPDRQVLRCRLEERDDDGVLHQLHARVVFPAFRTAVIVQLMTPVDGQAEFTDVFDTVVASVRLP